MSMIDPSDFSEPMEDFQFPDSVSEPGTYLLALDRFVSLDHSKNKGTPFATFRAIVLHGDNEAQIGRTLFETFWLTDRAVRFGIGRLLRAQMNRCKAFDYMNPDQLGTALMGRPFYADVQMDRYNPEKPRPKIAQYREPTKLETFQKFDRFRVSYFEKWQAAAQEDLRHPGCPSKWPEWSSEKRSTSTAQGMPSDEFFDGPEDFGDIPF